MSVSWMCPQCGGTTNHFSRARSALVCDTCGQVVQTEAERREDINYERTLSLARQHLQVGNWDEAKRLIKPFCSTRPTDKQLYLMLLMATTKGYSDLLVNNDAQRKEAAEYWDKLSRLGCINNTMKNYMRRRLQFINEENNIILAKKGVALGLSTLISIIALCMISASNDSGAFFIVLAIASWIISVKYIRRLSINHITAQLNKLDRDSPFL